MTATGRDVRVLAVHRYYWPDTPPYASLLREIVQRWSKAGHDVEVLERERKPPVDAERPVAGRRGRGHAEPAVVVDAARAQGEPGELAELVCLLVGEATAAEHGDGVGAVLAAYDGQPVVCLAGTDPAYAEWGAPLVAALRDAGATHVILAGKPKGIDVDDSCAVGVDALTFLNRTREALA